MSLRDLTTVHLEIIMYLANGLSYDEIAEKTSYSVGVVKKKVSQAKKAADAKTPAHLVSILIAHDVLVWEPEDRERVLAD